MPIHCSFRCHTKLWFEKQHPFICNGLTFSSKFDNKFQCTLTILGIIVWKVILKMNWWKTYHFLHKLIKIRQGMTFDCTTKSKCPCWVSVVNLYWETCTCFLNDRVGQNWGLFSVCINSVGSQPPLHPVPTTSSQQLLSLWCWISSFPLRYPWSPKTGPHGTTVARCPFQLQHMWKK